MIATELTLKPVPPFRLDLTAWALRRRPVNLIDRWDGRSYRRRVAVASGETLEIEVTQHGAADAPRLKVVARGEVRPEVGAIRELVARLLGVGADLTGFYTMAAGDRHLGPLVAALRGLKPPRFPSVFEALANAIACQQISLTAGLSVLGRVAAACDGSGASGALRFPSPAEISRLGLTRLRAAGLSNSKALALLELAEAASSAALDLESLAQDSDEVAIARLCALRGIGRWSAEYALLRGLGRISIFPGDDSGAQGKLREWLRLRKPLNAERTRRMLRRWVPFAGMVYFHLLLRGMAIEPPNCTADGQMPDA